MRQFLKITSTLALALVFTTGTALGQTNNEADVTQTSEESQATVTQSGDNFTELTQTVTSEATVTQTGDGNQVGGKTPGGFVQKGNGPKNTANIDQIGDDNTVTGIGGTEETQTASFFGSNEMTVDQFGDLNTLRVLQKGNGTATITQSNSGGSGRDGNTAKVTQDSYKSSAVLNLKQVGLENTSTISQKGGSDFINIDVAGVGNDVDADQTGGGKGDLYLNMQDAGTTAGGGQRYNTVDIYQTGSGNSVLDAGISGRVNTVTVTQSGSGNSVDGSSSGIGQADGLYVEGNYNTVTVNQYSNNNLTDIQVVGSNNNATITQQSN